MTEEKPKYKRTRTPAQANAESKYRAKSVKTIALHLNRNTDADIISRLDYAARCGDSVPQYIRSCIRYEMAHECIDPAPPEDAE